MPRWSGVVWRRVVRADLSLNAAAVAFHAFLALVPLTLAVIATGSLLGRDEQAIARVAEALEPIAPEAVTEFITSLLVDAGSRIGGSWWVLVVSVLVSVALGSRAVVALQRALGAVEGRIEVRPAVQLRLVATALTVAGGLALLLAGFLLVGGRSMFVFLAHLIGPVVLDLWTWLRLPIAALGLFGFLLLCYRYGPPVPIPRPAVAAALATGGVVAGSLAFGFYLSRAATFGATFGVLGAVAVALVWLHLGAWMILAGAVLTSGGDNRPIRLSDPDASSTDPDW